VSFSQPSANPLKHVKVLFGVNLRRGFVHEFPDQRPFAMGLSICGTPNETLRLLGWRWAIAWMSVSEMWCSFWGPTHPCCCPNIYPQQYHSWQNNVFAPPGSESFHPGRGMESPVPGPKSKWFLRKELAWGKIPTAGAIICQAFHISMGIPGS
jgi:hypothetical protein